MNHGHCNSYKGEHLTGTGLQLSGLVHYQHGRQHGSAGEVAENSTSRLVGSRKRECHNGPDMGV